jgi:hypothetical protein
LAQLSDMVNAAKGIGAELGKGYKFMARGIPIYAGGQPNRPDIQLFRVIVSKCFDNVM